MLNNLPEEAVAEVLFELSVNVGAVWQDLVLVPANQCILQEKRLGSIGQELLGVGQLVQTVDFISAHRG